MIELLDLPITYEEHARSKLATLGIEDNKGIKISHLIEVTGLTKQFGDSVRIWRSNER